MSVDIFKRRLNFIYCQPSIDTRELGQNSKLEFGVPLPDAEGEAIRFDMSFIQA